MREAVIILLMLLAGAIWRLDVLVPLVHGTEEAPYSCRQLYDAQRQCAFGNCDPRVIERLRNECLRDGGRP